MDQVKAVSSPHWRDNLRTALEHADDIDIDKLHNEDGTTTKSLHNAKVLLSRHGLPDKIRLRLQDKPADYVVVADWNRDMWPAAPNIYSGVRHQFHGFSWGYLGPAPQGLAQFFRMIDLDIPRLTPYITSLPGLEDKKKPAKWTRGRKAWDPTVADKPGLPTFKKGVDYGIEE